MTTTRPIALGQRGMVASPHYMASLAGVRTLEEGGTAVDAAIAVNAVLSVVYPHMTGIGGDAIWLIFDAETKHIHALNGSGRAGCGATRRYFHENGHATVPTVGPLAAITVPGAVSSWFAANKRFGRLPVGDLLAPAIRHARDGIPATAGLARAAADQEATLAKYSATRQIFLPDGKPPKHGDIIKTTSLANTLEYIAENGVYGFYEGRIAEAIVRSLRAAGGLLRLDDFSSHRSDWADPISTTYRDFTCYQHPPNSQGLVHLIALNILEGFEIDRWRNSKPEYFHVCAEATKLAYAVRERYLTDPEHARIPLDQLLSKEYANQLRSRISLNSAIDEVASIDVHGDTTCTVVVDADGNAASVIQSICHAFGSGFVAGDTGILLHNRGSKFSLREDHANTLEPTKRTAHTLMPGIVMQGDAPWLVYGTMGGDGQPQTNTAIVTRTIDFGHDIQSAIDAPRALYGEFWGERTNDLWIEDRLEADLIDGLKRLGQPVRKVAAWAEIMGHAQGITIDRARGILMGGSDPRGDGMAIGL